MNIKRLTKVLAGTAGLGAAGYGAYKGVPALKQYIEHDLPLKATSVAKQSIKDEIHNTLRPYGQGALATLGALGTIYLINKMMRRQ